MKNYTCGDRKFEIKVDEVEVAPGLSIEKTEQRQDRTQERGGGVAKAMLGVIMGEQEQ